MIINMNMSMNMNMNMDMDMNNYVLKGRCLKKLTLLFY